MNETLKNLETRRSCRKFKPDMITDEELNSVLRAGTYAPNRNGQAVSDHPCDHKQRNS